MSVNVLFNYPGGKKRLSKEIYKIIPPHKRYVEAFAGGAYMFFFKPLADENIINDIDNNLYMFYKVLRDNDKFTKLFRKLSFTLYSRKEFIEATKIETSQRNNNEDDIETARKFFVLINCSYSGKRKKGGFYRGNYKDYFNRVSNLYFFHNKLKDAIIENLDWSECIRRFDSADTLFFLDPPYPFEVMTKRDHYKYMMTTKEHENLVDILKHIKGKAILCSYENDIYNKLDWNVIKINSPIYIKSGKQQKGRIYKQECIYYNYNI